jgi:hypothetical protein
MSTLLVSTFANATDTTPRDLDVSLVLKAIRTGGKELRGQIEQIRNRFKTEHAITADYKKAKLAVDALKKALPAVTWSGTFAQRATENLRQHSGLLVADLDSLGEKLADVRKKLLESRHLWALFVSPRGDGLKAVFRVRVDAQKHLASWRAVEKHVLELTGIQIDESGKDMARLCFLSYDPELYVNENATELEPLPEPEQPKRTPPDGEYPPDVSLRERVAFEVLGELDWSAGKGGYFCRCPGEAYHTTGTAEKHCIIYLEGSPTIKCQHNSCGSIVETYNYRLRSEIAKAEYAQQLPHARATLPAITPEYREPAQLPPPYVSPPLTLLPSPLLDYVRTAAESLNVDVAYVFLPLLSALGAAVGNARSIILKGKFIQPQVLWTGIVGRTGSRKSPAIEAGCFAVMEHERELARQNKQAREQYEDDMADWEHKSRKERGAKPEPTSLLTCLMDDLTLPTLADALQHNPRGVLIRKDELSHWFASFDQYTNAKGADVSRWLSLHTGVFFGLDRRTDERSYRLWQPRVCITGGIQPQILRRILSEEFFERGLTARFLFASPPMRKDRWSEATIPNHLCAAVIELFNELWLLQPEAHESGSSQPRLLRLDPHGRQLFVEFYNRCGESAVESDEHGEAAWCKLSGYAARLALVGQLARDPQSKVVTGDTMQAACELARWFGNEALRIYAALTETREQREQRKLVEFVESHGGRVRVRDVMQNYTPLKNKKDEAERQLNALVKLGSGKWLESRPAGPGRPTYEFQLLSLSTSTQFGDFRGKTRNSVDVDASATGKITSAECGELNMPAGIVEL